MLTGSEGISTYKGQERALRAGRIGTTGLLLSVLAAGAPLMVVAGVMPTTYAVMGIVGQPLLFVLLAAVLALFSVGYAEMSRHVHNAGAFYAYISRGLGGTAGAAASFVALAGYSALQVGVYGLFGYQVSALAGQYLGASLAWWVPALAAVAVVAVLGALKIDLNAKVIGVLLVIECLFVVVFDVAFLADPGPQGVSLEAFDPSTLVGAGLGTALCFAIAAFTGFEQAPVYAEETSSAQTVVGRVMFWAVGFSAVFYALSSWAIGVATGPDHVVGTARDEGAGMIFVLSGERLDPVFTDALNVFFTTGILACMLSFHNVVARYAFAMGREGLLPRAVGRASKSSGAPAIGSLLQTAVSVTVVGAFALAGKDPIVHLFTWMGNVGALGVLLLMVVTSVAIIAFFVRRGAAAAQAPRLVCSGLAGAALLVILCFALADFDVLVAAQPGSPLAWILPGLIGAAAVVGALHGLALKLRRPEQYARIGLGNEAFQLEIAAEREAGRTAPVGTGG
ncbi:APC family permease [Streptomyces sp. NPDC059506]|uniref:APC family permease n=1 Tax=Streptomyces sp. NPDC059506 TaxID=3347751 RepID=UPI00367F1E2F